MKNCPKEGCGQPHENPGRFCSRKCANSRSFSPEAIKKKSEAAKKNCQDPEFRQKNVQALNKYWQEVKSGERESYLFGLKLIIEQVESGTYKTFTPRVIQAKVRRYLLHKRGNQCQICGNTEWLGKPIPLACDHIDGKHENVELSNFRLVCLNCDGLLPTYKSKNWGNGSKVNREYKRRRVEKLQV